MNTLIAMFTAPIPSWLGIIQLFVGLGLGAHWQANRK